MMRGKLQIALLVAGALFAALFLSQIDYTQKIDTNVLSLLPKVDSEAARIARRLISEEQGRGVYLEVEGLSGAEISEEQFVGRLESSEWVESARPVDERSHLEALKWVNEHRFELLFPDWYAGAYRDYQESGAAGPFPAWASARAVDDLDAFLESPAAFELARPELMDPLLLAVGALLRFSEGQGEGWDGDANVGSSSLYWVKLAASPLSPLTQDGFRDLIAELEGSWSEGNDALGLRYGGLIALAQASRERIQGDVIKINVLSVLGVALMCGLIARRPWRMLWAAPTLIGGASGGLAVSFLVFESVNIIVLVVGSILIGTAIDYAIHLIFREEADDVFPTRKLIGYACFSTVIGFSVLVFSELELIRQIGVFVGAGLLSAYLVARATIAGSNIALKSVGPSRMELLAKPSLAKGVSILVLLLGAWGWLGLQWKDDLRNLEAPNQAVVDRDMELRSKFGARPEGSVFLVTGSSYLEVMEREAVLLQSLDEDGALGGFGFSQVLPEQSDVALLESRAEELPRFFALLREALEEGGYDSEAFAGFFKEAGDYASGLANPALRAEESILGLANRLSTSLQGMMGGEQGRYWSLSTVPVERDVALQAARTMEGITLFSQLSFLNASLDKHRGALLRFGAGAALLVGATVVIVFGVKKGLLIVAYPALAGIVAVGISSLLFEALNMFHLVGCFLGGAIAFDYALFAIESYQRGMALPRSIWLSAGTTTASFAALCFSAIPVVRSLGVVVVLLACVTLLLLHSSQAFLRNVLGSDGAN